MIKFESDCVGCPENMGCIGNTCPYQNQVVFECDECENEFEELFDFDGEQLCETCLLEAIGARRINANTYEDFLDKGVYYAK